MIKIVITDDHPMMSEGIKQSLSSFNHLNIVSVCSNGQQAIEVLKNEKIEVLLLDVEMPVMNGIECAEYVLTHFIGVKVIMLSMHQDTAVIASLQTLGVHGYLLKTSLATELNNAIVQVHQGKKWFKEQYAGVKNNHPSQTYNSNNQEVLDSLSKRETEILSFIAKGYTNKEIANELFISSRTVDTHRTNLMKKVEVNNVAGLIRFAFQMNLN